MADSTSESLVTIADAQLHEVNGGNERLLEWGQLELSVHSVEGVSGLWLKVGNTEWNVDTALPVLKAADRTFMFAMGNSRFLSVLLAQGTPGDSVAIFEEVLVECTSFEYAGAMSKQATDETVAEVAEEVVNSGDDAPLIIEPPPQQPGHQRTNSDRILSGAAAVQGKLLASANWASQKLIDQSRAMQAKTEPGKPVNVSPQMSQRVKLARSVAEKGNRAANRVAGGIADVSVKLADSIVSRLGPNNKYGQQLNDPAQRPNAAKEVAAAAVVAAVGIYDSMEQAARIVLTSGGQASSEYIGHKYGQDAGQLAKDATSATITTGMTAMTMQKIGVKKIAKRIAKRTASGLAKSYLLGPNQPGSSAPGQANAPPQPGGLPAASGQTSAGQQQSFGQPPFGVQGPYAQAQPQLGPAEMQRVVHGAPLQASHPRDITETAQAPIEYRSPFANSD